VCAELEDLKSEMAELHQIPSTAARQTVKEVILTKINILSAKIASLNESVGGGDIETKWPEVVAGRRKIESIR
jgi:hypothetical protein